MSVMALPGLPPNVRLVVRADCAGCSQEFLAHLRQAQVGFSVGFEVNEAVREAIRALPDEAWVPAVRQTVSRARGRRWPRSPANSTCPPTRKAAG